MIFMTHLPRIRYILRLTNDDFEADERENLRNVYCHSGFIPEPPAESNITGISGVNLG